MMAILGERVAQLAPSRVVLAGPLCRASLPQSHSKILAATAGQMWLFNLRGGRGWFSKENPASFHRGRTLCDQVITRYSCHGFFTTDELPRYGLSRGDRRAIFNAYTGVDQISDVLVILAYDDFMLAKHIRDYIIKALRTDPRLS